MNSTWLSSALLTTGLLLYGCADQSPVSPTDDGTVPTPAAKLTISAMRVAGLNNKAAIKIGLLTTDSGGLEFLGLSHKSAARMAVAEINAAGGIFGKEVKLIQADTETNPDRAVAVAQDLVDQGVVAIVGPIISSAAVQVANQVTVPNGIVLVSPSATSPVISALDDENLVWRAALSDAFKGKITARYAYNAGSRRAGMIFIDSEFGRGLRDEFTREFENLGGQVINSVSYPELTEDEIEAHDYRPYADALFADNPDMVYLVTFEKDGIKITLASESHISDTYHPQIIGDIPPSREFAANASQIIVQGMIGFEARLDLEHPNSVAFLGNFRDRYGFEPVPFSDSVYDAISLLTYAMMQANSVDAKAIAANLQSVSREGTAVININEFYEGHQAIKTGKNINYEGASGSIDLDERGDVDVTGATFAVWRIENEDFVDIDVISFP
jgi:ABC-type branched-subunit amino acid transport system substrate-binding protein